MANVSYSPVATTYLQLASRVGALGVARQTHLIGPLVHNV
jgi:hypothetical protein